MVDSSAIVAIVLGEPEAMAFMEGMIAETSFVAAPTLVETRIVLARRGVRDPMRATNLVAAQGGIEVVPFDEDLAGVAFDAFLRFGKGRHPARLNFGDCMAYALAKSLDAPLLYTGDDFARTDIRPALARRP